MQNDERRVMRRKIILNKKVFRYYILFGMTFSFLYKEKLKKIKLNCKCIFCSGRKTEYTTLHKRIKLQQNGKNLFRRKLPPQRKI